jgi:C-terminal processing protease CtpA/Prc
MPYWLLCAEVLHGLGITDGGRATFTFERRGERWQTELEPITAAEYAQRFPFLWQQPAPPPGAPQPLWVRYRDAPQAVTTLQRGKFVYAAYTVTQDPRPLVERILRLARKPAFRRLIVDVRQNGGGNNSTYFPLLDALKNRWVVWRSRPVVLTGRTTFSAAGNFVAEVEQFTRARLVGEPPGGSANQWGDFAPVTLPNVGLEVMVATVYVERGRTGDTRPAIEPHVRVELSTEDWLAGRDPVLAAALR